MAEVSFTLEDIRGVIREEVPALVKPLIEGSELRITTAVAATFAEYEQKYDARFDHVDQRLDELGRGLKEVKSEVKGHGRLVRQHSVEIMELKST